MKLRHVLPLGILLMAGCRHVPVQEDVGRSSFAFINPPVGPPPKSDGEVHEVVDRAQYWEAQLQEPAALPVYPARALKARAKLATVGVHITVDTSGRVSSIRSSILIFSTPGQFSGDFRDAVELAVSQWQFTPARAEYFEIVHEGTATYNRATRAEQVETEFDLAFTFTTDGRVEQSPTGR